MPQKPNQVTHTRLSNIHNFKYILILRKQSPKAIHKHEAETNYPRNNHKQGKQNFLILNTLNTARKLERPILTIYNPFPASPKHLKLNTQICLISLPCFECLTPWTALTWVQEFPAIVPLNVVTYSSTKYNASP